MPQAVLQSSTPARLDAHHLRSAIADAIESLIALLDAIDGDCEDEGAQCEDEGFDSDREPEEGGGQCVVYAEDGSDQTRMVSAIINGEPQYTRVA